MIPRRHWNTSGMKDWVDFRAVKQAVSLEAVLRHYQVSGLNRYRDQLQGCCPIHRGKRDDSFRAHRTKNAFHCFACQASGNVLDFVAAMENCSIREAALRLQQWFGVSAPAGSAEARPGPGAALATESVRNEQLVRGKECNPPLPFALRGVEYSHPYLVERGIDPATAVAFGVGFYAAPGLPCARWQAAQIQIPRRFPQSAGAFQPGPRSGHQQQDRDPGRGVFRLPAGSSSGVPVGSSTDGIFSFGEAGESLAAAFRTSASDARWGCGRSRRQSSHRGQIVSAMLSGNSLGARRRPAGCSVSWGPSQVAGPDVRDRKSVV